ncbi:hypothetical protein FGIG_01590 [Fasciola gigantica]|uniref:Uncharacterized protein n=1 Tax=Fasciola gigantica TaxID=46835 RepID=A0A504YH00_FASGI|nr:hypothetical protein FGIG_01590 [Fasciola gigantica]
MLGSRRKSHVMVTRLDVVATPERLPNHIDKENLFPVKVTVPKPFSFEAREMEVLHKRKVLVECADKRAVELANSFRARPMRVGSPDPLPRRPAPSPVRPMPFSFRTEE